MGNACSCNSYAAPPDLTTSYNAPKTCFQITWALTYLKTRRKSPQKLNLSFKMQRGGNFACDLHAECLKVKLHCFYPLYKHFIFNILHIPFISSWDISWSYLNIIGPVCNQQHTVYEHLYVYSPFIFSAGYNKLVSL